MQTAGEVKGRELEVLGEGKGVEGGGACKG